MNVFCVVIQTHIILALAWIIYCILHSVFASQQFKSSVRKWMGEHFKFYRLYYTLFAFFGFATIIFYLLKIPSTRIFQTTSLTKVIAGIIIAKGSVIMILCIWKYFFQLSGLRSLVQERKSDELMITGIHRYVRHPLYMGTFIFIWGLWLLIPSASLMITDVIITIYTIIGIGFEEKKLEDQFGESYRKYKQQVPMLIPKF